MARSRPVDNQRSRSKSALVEELTASIAKFQEILRTIEDCSQEGFPYRDAAQAKAELQLKERVRQTFGERSQEFLRCRTIKLRTGNRADAEQSLAMIKGLIRTLEERKLELQGLKPPPPPIPPPDATMSNTARLVLVTPATSAPTGTTLPTIPTTVAVAMTTNVSPPVAPMAPPVQQHTTHVEPEQPVPLPEPPVSDLPAALISPTKPLSPASATLSTPIDPAPLVLTSTCKHPPVGQHPDQSSPVNPVRSASPSPREHATIVQQLDQSTPPIPVASLLSSPEPVIARTPVAHVVPNATLSREQPAVVEQSRESIPSTPYPSQVAQPQPSNSTTAIAPHPPITPRGLPSMQPPPQDQPFDHLWTTPPNTQTTPQSIPDQDPLSLIRKICLRVHSVVRQLRLRKDYRPTLEVEDDYDLQDLFCALLKVEFDEVATEEWIPPYADGAPRTTFFVNKDQIAILTRKTRPGLTTKELADQLLADTAYYRTQGRCSTLLCFVYDPEGRIGSPKRLESTLTSVNEHYRVEVLVAPK